jgi:hypothetical protein
MAEARSGERSLLRKALSPSCDCATPLELGRLADGSLAEPDAARLSVHISGCTRCQIELELFNLFEDAAPRPDEKSAVASISARLERQFSEASAGPPPLQAAPAAALRRRSVFTAVNLGGLALAAATLAAAVTIGLRERRTPDLAPPSLSTPTVLRSAGITTLSPLGNLDAVPTELRWQPQAGAASYSVQVTEVDHAGLWSDQTRDAVIALPEALRARMVPGKPLLWEVVAKDANGRAVAWSGQQRFRMKK